MDKTRHSHSRYKYFILVLLLLYLLVIYFARSTYLKNSEVYIGQKEEEFKIGLQAVFHRFEVVSQNLINDFLSDTVALSIIAEASTSDAYKRTQLRQDAMGRMNAINEKMEQNLLKCFNVYFADNASFLRLSDPDLYEYNAGMVPSLVSSVNITHEYLSGFETGPASAGYRYVFPLLYKGEYLGCIETGVDFFGIRAGLKKIFPYEFRFLINKDYLISKTPFTRLDNFRMSDLSEDFLYEKPTQLLFEQDTSRPRVSNPLIVEFNKKGKTTIHLLLQDQITFGHSETIEDIPLLALFYKIQSPDHLDLAYIVAYSKDSTLQGFRTAHYIIMVAAIVLLTAIGILIAMVLNNISVIRKKNQELEKATHSLEALNQAKDKFFSVIAHDLRNPFHGLVGLSQVLVEDYDQMDREKVRKFHHLVYQSAKQGYQLVLNLLEWTRSQTGRMSFQPEKTDLARIVDENLKLTKSLAIAKQIQIRTEVGKNLIAMTDYNMIHTVIRNLLSNAIKFSFAGSEILVKGEKSGNQILISVHDQGVGMDPETLNNLFKIDVSQSATGTQGEMGTGLGLILCKEFIQKHKGSIYVESEKGKGSVFTISIPAMQ